MIPRCSTRTPCPYPARWWFRFMLAVSMSLRPSRIPWRGPALATSQSNSRSSFPQFPPALVPFRAGLAVPAAPAVAAPPGGWLSPWYRFERASQPPLDLGSPPLQVPLKACALPRSDIASASRSPNPCVAPFLPSRPCVAPLLQHDERGPGPGCRPLGLSSRSPLGQERCPAGQVGRFVVVWKGAPAIALAYQKRVLRGGFSPP